MWWCFMLVVGGGLVVEVRGVRGRQGGVTRHRGTKRFDRGGWPLQVRGGLEGEEGRRVEKFGGPKEISLLRIHPVWAPIVEAGPRGWVLVMVVFSVTLLYSQKVRTFHNFGTHYPKTSSAERDVSR